MLRGDGSVSFVSDSVNFDAYRAAATVDGSLDREVTTGAL
jgi:hypothetical protein